MFEAPSALFSMTGIVYGLVLPLLVLHVIAMLFIPGLAASGVKVMGLGKAIYCFLLQALGILLMTLGGLPAGFCRLPPDP